MVACCNRMRQCDERSQKRDLRRDSIEEGDASCETRNDRLHTAKYRHRKRRMRGGERRRARYRLKQAVFSPTMYAIAADMIPMMVPHHEPEKPAAPNGKAGFQAWNTVPSFSRQQHLTEKAGFLARKQLPLLLSLRRCLSLGGGLATRVAGLSSSVLPSLLPLFSAFPRLPLSFLPSCLLPVIPSSLQPSYPCLLRFMHPLGTYQS